MKQTWTIFSLEWTTSPELELNLTLEIFFPPPNTSLTILYLTIVVSMFTGKLRIWKQDSTWNKLMRNQHRICVQNRWHQGPG